MNRAKSFIGALSLVALSLTLTNCGSSSNPSNLSAGASGYASDPQDSGSALVADAVGGALSNSSSSGTMAQINFQPQKSTSHFSLENAFSILPQAFAQLICPTFKSTDSDCQTSGSSMWLSYNNCSFAGYDLWQGVQEIAMSQGTAQCGSFPNPGANGVLYRQYVQAAGSGVPGQLNLTTSNETGTIDDESANLDNFDGDTIAPLFQGGYGTAVQFDSAGARSQITIAHHTYVSGLFDHSVYGSVNVAESPGASSRVVSGSVTVYHNYLRVIGTSTLTNVVHEDACCLPVSGTISTTFSAGANVTPTKAGEKAIGKTETLTFNGCGTGQLQTFTGETVSVHLLRCF